MNSSVYDERLLNPELIRLLFRISKDEPIKDIYTVLDNDRYVKRLYELKRNQINNFKIEDDPFLRQYDGLDDLRRDIIENYILYLSQNYDNSRDEAYFFKYYRMYSDLIKSSSLLNNVDNSIIDSRIMKRYNQISLMNNNPFRKDDEEIYNITVNNIKKRSMDILDLVESNIESGSLSGIRISDFNYAMEFLSSSLDTNKQYLQELQEKVANFLLKSNQNYGLFATKYLVKYSSYKYCEDNNLPIPPVYLTDEKLKDFGILTFSPNLIKGYDVKEKAQYIYNQLEKYRLYIEPIILKEKEEEKKKNPFYQ